MKKGNFKSQVTRQKKINQGFFFLFFFCCRNLLFLENFCSYFSIFVCSPRCSRLFLLTASLSQIFLSFFLLIFSLTQIFSLSSGKSETNALAGRSSHYALACCSGKILLLAVFNLHHILNCA